MTEADIPTRGRAWTQWLALGGLVLSVLAGTLVPIYTDETGWRFQERAAIDGGLDVTFSDVCGPNSIARAPWFMMPVRWFSAAANRALADPLCIRLEGVACALAWIALFWVLVQRLEGQKARRVEIRTLAYSLLGLGLLPYVLVLSRPEQPIILTTTLILLLTAVPAPRLAPAGLAWLKAIGIVALATIALSYHIKGVLYAGLAAVCLAVSVRGRGTAAPRIVGVVVLAGLAIASAKYWTGRFSCPDDPQLAALLNSVNVASVLANGGHLTTVLAKMIVSADPLGFVGAAAPRSDPLSNWLPPGLFPWPVAVALLAGMFILWAAAILLAVASMARFALAAKGRLFAEPRMVIAIALLGLVLVWGASQLNKNVYEAGHILPALAILGVLAATLPHPAPLLSTYATRLARLVLPFALCSELVVLGLTLPALAQAARSPGYIRDQDYSISAFGYAAVRRDIAAARAASGMATTGRLERPMIDELTYLALQDSHLPIHRLGVLSVWNGRIDDPAGYLKSRRSDGVVVGCHLLPPAMRAAASRSGEICAISRDGLARAAASEHRIGTPGG
jgi:hypothetical protein